ncbi:uncharacterized protein Tco025E_08204 [Trypanosoma conorhini]|uniref:Uncharacterized protein n=1 Tax=Trypanosoma conorhini TaxID=83891 RepID=A0A3S5IQZ1_9TRYP|nr:uncharacterized protein Tco025E_08204 [Trypanosoma conorhini]RNF03301.1 hypothetical protein Tco025E_08204 [Trypanosoma conorhini]
MLHRSSWQGRLHAGSAASEERGASEERERALQRLPASVQAMLLRANLKLTEREMQSISCATADQRCEALRMIFEGQSAQDAVFFLLNLSCRSTSSATAKAVANPAARAAIMGVTGASQAVAPLPSHSALETPPSPDPEPFPRERLPTAQALPPPSLRSTVMNYGCSTEDEEDRRSSSSSSVPSPHPRPQKAPSRALSEIRVNTAALPAAMNVAKVVSNQSQVTVTKGPDPCVVGCPQRVLKGTPAGNANKAAEESSRPAFLPVSTCLTSTACSAWNERYQTFIVHPNQLKRLEELKKHMTPPTVIHPRNGGAFHRLKTDMCRPFALPCTTLTTAPPAPLWVFHQKRAADPGRGAAPITPRTRSAYHHTVDEEDFSSAPCVPPLTNLKSITRKEGVFVRLYTNSSVRGTPRAATARGGTSTAFANERTRTPRSATARRSSSSYRWRAAVQDGDGMGTRPTWWPPGRSTTPHAYCRHTTPVGVISARGHGGGLTSAAASWKKPPKTTASSREGAVQPLRRNATAMDTQPRFVRTSTWSSRRDPHGVYH